MTRSEAPPYALKCCQDGIPLPSPPLPLPPQASTTTATAAAAEAEPGTAAPDSEGDAADKPEYVWPEGFNHHEPPALAAWNPKCPTWARADRHNGVLTNW